MLPSDAVCVVLGLLGVLGAAEGFQSPLNTAGRGQIFRSGEIQQGSAIDAPAVATREQAKGVEGPFDWKKQVILLISFAKGAIIISDRGATHIIADAPPDLATTVGCRLSGICCTAL